MKRKDKKNNKYVHDRITSIRMRKLQVINTNPRRLQWFKFTANCEKDNGDITLFSLEEAK